MPRIFTYCCLRRLSSDNPHHCKKRFDKNSKKSRLGVGDFWMKFMAYADLGDYDFEHDDFICDACSLKVRFIFL
jgi:hypothetical protein